MIKPNTSIYYHYNEYNEVCGISYNGKEYFIDRDIVTKNIDKILDKQGKVMVQYKYTAYGIPTISIGTNLNSTEIEEATILMNENIFLYKGYVYDNETGLYYCNSRYYNPEWGRFISPDSIDYLDPKSINGLNLYAYCGNDPVNNYDPRGHLVITLTSILVAAGIGLAAGAIGGGAAGGISAAANGDNIGFGILAGAIGGGMTDLLNQVFNNQKTTDPGSIFISALEGGALNMLSGLLGSLGGTILSNADNFILSLMLNTIPSGYGTIIDIIRNYLNRKRKLSYAS